MRQLQLVFPAYIIIAFAFLLLTGCTQKATSSYTKNSNSVIFNIGRAKLSISLVDTAIMQVKYTLTDNFSTKKNLIIEDKKWPYITFEVKDSANEVMITTSRLKAIVNSLTGAVVFYNDKGQLLLKEKDGTSKTITPTVFDAFKTDTISQQFQATRMKLFMA